MFILSKQHLIQSAYLVNTSSVDLVNAYTVGLVNACVVSLTMLALSAQETKCKIVARTFWVPFWYSLHVSPRILVKDLWLHLMSAVGLRFYIIMLFWLRQAAAYVLVVFVNTDFT